jgi:2-oxoisovalerate dehydrogenase E1 component
MTFFTENSPTISTARVVAEDCFIATGPAYAAPLPSKDGIITAALKLTGGRS